MRRRLRPTLLLQFCAHGASLAIFGGAIALLGSHMSLWVLLALLLFWLLALHLELLPMFLEWWLVRRAERIGGLLSSPWFTYSARDADATERERGRHDTKDNPALW